MADKVVNKKNALTDNRVIENLLDNQLAGLIQELPDPDVILRKANIDHEVYREIMADPHVIGEIRPLRAGLLNFKSKIVPGDDSKSAQSALELCESIFKKKPHTVMGWPDLIWSMGKAPLVGRRVHHVKWRYEGQYLLPESIFDINTYSYCFSYEGELLIRTMDTPEGEDAEEYRWLVTRHMPERENPYGVALLSTCFWPWMFKNGGLKFFVKFCEKFGVPWPVGKYSEGATPEQINKLLEDLQNMVEDAVAVVPENFEIAMLEVKSGGELPQERLANFMNREMSKALTSQSLATEIIDGGSRAAAETHSKRTDNNQKTDRMLVADTLNELFAWITELNFGPEVPPPEYKYDDKKELNAADVKYYDDASRLVPIKKEDIYKALQISQPAEGDEVVFTGGQSKPDDLPEGKAEFAKGTASFSAEDIAISDIVDQVKAAIDEGETLEEALQNIIDLMPDLEKDALDELVRNELQLEFGIGMLEAENA